ncbi:MAG: hypothetical protein JRH07_09480 [Deltaproteobacteria bacterium]|nr:hypothetical protein [Deltaproteobacteria bacterium]MBW2122063.1 hypothetical protein [Deltaproteobacteria bacterium]
MGNTLDRQSIKTIEDLIQSQMIEKEALVRLLIKKGVITPDEFKGEVAMLSRRIQEQRK